MIASIVLNDMDRSQYAAYGFRSWLLQDLTEEYEVILNLFNDKKAHFEALAEGANPFCRVRIISHEPPRFFNISAANNLGLHYARGKYVLFANSDIVHQGSYLRSVMTELERRALSYVMGTRVNLNALQTSRLLNPLGYTRTNAFTDLIGMEHEPGRTLVGYLSPWTALRAAAIDIGGFDSAVTCHEDADFNARMAHYLCRTGRQGFLYAITDLYGYHLDHPPSELYDASARSKALLEPRRARLAKDQDSTADVVPTDLQSLPALLHEMYNTPLPAPSFRGVARKHPAIRKLRRVWQVLREP